jgi:F0F1-type ATP synthase membrane subunit b/b'
MNSNPRICSALVRERACYARFALLLILLSSFALTGVLTASEVPSPSELQAQPPTQAPVTSSSRPATISAEQPGREAQADDDQAQFKQSASIRFLAKITGLTPEQCYWLCVVVNFGILAGFLVWATKKNLPGAFRSRTAAIQKALAEARSAGHDASQRLAEIEERLARLDQEIAEMAAAAEREAQQEELRIQAATEHDARRILESAEQEIAAVAKSARRDLAAYAADLAVALATKQIRVDDSVDHALVEGFAKQLSDSAGSGGREAR